jgi:hypothetical protein
MTFSKLIKAYREDERREKRELKEKELEEQADKAMKMIQNQKLGK